MNRRPSKCNGVAIKPSATILDAKKGHSFLTISIFSNGEIIIQDSSNDHRGEELIRRLKTNGVDAEITYEGLCG